MHGLHTAAGGPRSYSVSYLVLEDMDKMADAHATDIIQNCHFLRAALYPPLSSQG